jgi:hypothetical protein
MTPEDEHIANLLRAAAPPARDAMFRLGVLARRERQRFQRRSLQLLAAALASVLCFWIGLRAGAGLAGAAMILFVCAALVVSYFLYAPAVRQLVRRFRA